MQEPVQFLVIVRTSLMRGVAPVNRRLFPDEIAKNEGDCTLRAHQKCALVPRIGAKRPAVWLASVLLGEAV